MPELHSPSHAALEDFDPSAVVPRLLDSVRARQIARGVLPAPSVCWRDRSFFRANPDRRYRVRYPLRKELRQVDRIGLLKPLRPGQKHVVIVHRHDGAISTTLAVVRLLPAQPLPDTDEEIVRSLGALAQGHPVSGQIAATEGFH
jgi:hypothetical protein